MTREGEVVNQPNDQASGPYAAPVPSLRDFNIGLTALNTGFANLQREQGNKLVEEQLQLQRQQQQLDHDFKLHSDPKYKEWWEERIARLGREYEAERQRQEREAREWAQEKRESTIKFWWVLGMVVVPYIVVWLPYSRRNLPQWGFYVLIAWTVFVVITAIVSNFTGSPSA